MDKLEYIPGDLVMVKKSALQFAKDKIFKVISSLSGGFVKVVMLNDGLPPYDESVLVTNKETPKIVLKTSRTKCKGWNTDENGFLCAIAFNITHWKPIEKLED